MLVYFICCNVYKLRTFTELDAVTTVMNPEQQSVFDLPTDVLSIVLMMCILASVVLSVLVMLVRLAQERARMRREAALQKLPKCKWQLAPGQHYLCFLSQCAAPL